MGKVTNLRWSTSSDEIQQPTSILLGRNLRKNSDEVSSGCFVACPSSGIRSTLSAGISLEFSPLKSKWP